MPSPFLAGWEPRLPSSVSLSSTRPAPRLGSAGSGNPGIVVASEPPFTEPFREDSGWITGEAVFLPGLPDRYTTLDQATLMLRNFFLAGLHAPRGEGGVTIIVPDGADEATEVHLFVILHGGANPMEVGEQFRAIARHDARGWWIDPQIETRIFCAVPFGEIQIRGGLVQLRLTGRRASRDQVTSCGRLATRTVCTLPLMLATNRARTTRTTARWRGGPWA